MRPDSNDSSTEPIDRRVYFIEFGSRRDDHTKAIEQFSRFSNVVAKSRSNTDLIFRRFSSEQQVDAFIAEEKNLRSKLGLDPTPASIWLCATNEKSAENLLPKLFAAKQFKSAFYGSAVGGDHIFSKWALQNLPKDWLGGEVGIRLGSAEGASENDDRLIQIDLKKNSAIALRGRIIISFGDGATVKMAATESYPAWKNELAGQNRFADIIAIRRFAIQRNGPLFPPKEVPKPIVEKGTLMIIGGGGMPRNLMNEFVKEAGGKDAIIAVIPISMPEPLPKRSRFAEMLKQLGAKEVKVITGRTPLATNDEETTAFLKKATGVWFGGGRQWRFVDAYQGTPAAELMHDVLARGGVIAGSSAGASIQGQYMARGNPLGSRTIMADGYEEGLGFLPGVAIDQHFTQRNRLPDLASLVDRYPQLLGIGIDETTAIVVKKNIANVVGKNRVCFYDRNKPVKKGQPDYEAVFANGSYDLVARKVISVGDSKPEKSDGVNKSDEEKGKNEKADK